MSARHAAALALVGWYLMAPPIFWNGETDSAAPLSYWSREGSFNDEVACQKSLIDHQQERRDRLKKSIDQLNALPDSIKRSDKPLRELAPDVWQAGRNANLAMKNALAMRCIATDDPHLKEK